METNLKLKNTQDFNWIIPFLICLSNMTHDCEIEIKYQVPWEKKKIKFLKILVIDLLSAIRLELINFKNYRQYEAVEKNLFDLVHVYRHEVMKLKNVSALRKGSRDLKYYPFPYPPPPPPPLPSPHHILKKSSPIISRSNFTNVQNQIYDSRVEICLPVKIIFDHQNFLFIDLNSQLNLYLKLWRAELRLPLDHQQKSELIVGPHYLNPEKRFTLWSVLQDKNLQTCIKIKNFIIQNHQLWLLIPELLPHIVIGPITTDHLEPQTFMSSLHRVEQNFKIIIFNYSDQHPM